MKKDEIIKKLTSRKFWVAVAGFVTGIILLCNATPETAESVGALIIAGGSIIGYLFGEALTDIARAKKDDNE